MEFQSTKRFSEELLNLVANSEPSKELGEKVTLEYNSLKAELEKEIAEELLKAKENHLKVLEAIENERLAGIKKNDDIFNALSEEDKKLKAHIEEHDNAIKGVNIVAKRARIKENNDYDLLEKDIKLARLFLYNDYSSLMKQATGKKRKFADAINQMILEKRATITLRGIIKNKTMWTNMIPLAMLIVAIVVFFVSNSITGYKGDMTDIINNGVFVAVVASGAVYIYSSGSFDMSLGAASLMCATLAGIVWNTTGNLLLALLVSLGLGAVLGIVNAILANVLGLPVMVMTLTMLNILNSIHAVILQTQGNELVIKPGMPAETVVYATYLVVFFLLCWAIFNYTKMGRRNKMIGSNQTAAQFSGISIMKTGIISFAISGIGLGIAGFLFTSYKSGSQFSTGTILDTIGLNVVIAIVFGGMTTSGGPRSRISCGIIGAFFCIFLDEIFRSLGIADYRFLAKGIVFLVVSLFNMWSTRPKMLAR